MKPARARTCMDTILLLRFICAAIAWLACGADAHADAPSAIVFPPRDSGKKSDARVVKEVRAALEKLELATPLDAPPLDLDAMQLTIDCVGESTDCLNKVAERSKARIVIAPSITRAKSGSTLRILYYDSSAHTLPTVAEHQAKGGDLDKETYAAIPEMLRGMFASSAKAEEKKPAVEAKAEEKEPEPEATTPAPAEVAQPASSDRPHKRFPLGPVVLGAGGVAVLTSGLVVGAMMKSTEKHYADRDVQNAQQAKKADDERKLGKQQALIADVLIGVGAAAMLGSAIWFAAGLVDSPAEQPQTALLPVVGTHSAMLSLSGVWEDRP